MQSAGRWLSGIAGIALILPIALMLLNGIETLFGDVIGGSLMSLARMLGPYALLLIPVVLLAVAALARYIVDGAQIRR